MRLREVFDGQVVQRTVLDDNGGRCRNVGQTTDGLPAFLYIQPCRPSVSSDVGLDTTGLSDGQHHLVVSVVDAAGNSAPVILKQLLAERDPARPLYFADESGGEAAAGAFVPGAALILTGPEGGFTAEERALVRAAPNAVPISLGPRILRAETAALAALVAFMATAGDWRP